MSGEDQALSFVYLVGALVLVVSALMVHRIPLGQGLKMFAAWVLIFLAAFVIFIIKDDIAGLGKRVWAEARGEGQVVQAGEELRIRKSDDGHFWVVAAVNGERVPFLIDSGATTTTLSAGAARSAGVEPSSSLRTLVETANGTASVARGRAGIKVGTIEREDLPVHISDRDDISLLGMNFLSTLSAWRVEGEWLILKP